MAKASHKDGSDQDLLLWICLIAIEAMISHAIIINTNSWINMEDRIKITVSDSNPINFLFWPNLPMALRNLCSCTIVALWVRNTAAWKSLDNQHIVSVSSWQRSYNIGWAAYCKLLKSGPQTLKDRTLSDVWPSHGVCILEALWRMF